MPRENGLYYTLVKCNLGRQSVPTEDGLYLFFRGNFLTTRVRRALYHA
jgi:hypothetical protein